MAPIIPKIKFVDKAGAFLTSDLLEFQVSIILHFVPILWIGFSIARVANNELMKMAKAY
jgi:hypothetical protein